MDKGGEVKLPVLLVSTEPVPLDDDQNEWKTSSFYDLSENRVCKFPLPVPIRDYYHGFCSSKGWLRVTDDYCREVLLFNPFSSVDNVIRLPSLEVEEDDIGDDKCIRKIVLSASPTLNPNYIIMATCGGNCSNAAFYKLGNCGWTFILDGEDIEDIIYYGNQFYAMTFGGSIWACDLSSYLPIVSKIAPSIDQVKISSESCSKYYVVETYGELLGVEGNWGSTDSPYTVNFRVFRLDQNAFKWNEIKSLCGQSLFVGSNTSMSLLASDFPKCKPNCIYFTDVGFGECDFPLDEVPHDMGVYNLEDETVEPYYPMQSFKHYYPAPIWV